ncbi:FecR family protein [Celeribacter indicus]|uniref:Putative transmembrane sensor protein n=1 Tax=Celeribacter indicus TaxID=1208324 RepID=A0A0B5DYY3_9RHOB|nr:FecR domain-containing protein [Celeribacter indicus]AJE48638.1 putative transmembrane sensor protein [Celeribacter indicus]SDX34669.1 FecR family protein [Celeribacter indicus]
MSDDETDRERDRALIEKEAVAWFTRTGGRPTRVERRDFAAWLEMSPEHARAYEDVSALWADLDATAHSLGEDGEELAGPLRKIADYRRARRRAKASGIVAGCLAVLAVSGWLWIDSPNLLQNLGADHVTDRAERRVVALADGSTVLMDADSALETEFSDRERRIRLLRGSAFFDVNPSPVPFVVEAAGGEARVLGTEFDVTLTGGRDVTVTLARGSLEVGLEGAARQVRLSPGERVEYGRAGLGAVQAVDLEESTAWHEGRLIFDDARLADVLAQIGRYREGRIVLLGSEVGERRVSGNISLENSEAALTAMQATVGFHMTRLGRRITLIGP